MAGSGMNEILAGTFGSVEKMLSGRKYPQNVRAIILLVEEMLQCILEGVDSFSHLLIVLDARASHSRTTNLWSDNLVKTVNIMKIFSQDTKATGLFTSMLQKLCCLISMQLTATTMHAMLHTMFTR